MMENPEFYMIMAGTGLIALAILCLAVLRGWSSWLDLRRAELASGARLEDGPPSLNTRIEVADLKERIRKLELIAAGVDL